jgi:chromosome segregation ATPase
MQQEISIIDASIAEEERKLSRDIEAERRPLRQKIEQANDEMGKLTIRFTKVRRSAEESRGEYRKSAEQYETIKSKIHNARQAEGEAQNRLNSVRRAKDQPIFAFGPLAQRVKDIVNQERRWKEKPIGPIGQLIKLNEPMYAAVLESYFGPTLNGWIVTNDHDLRLMNSIKAQLRLFVWLSSLSSLILLLTPFPFAVTRTTLSTVSNSTTPSTSPALSLIRAS